MLSKKVLLDFRLHKRLPEGVFFLFDHFGLLPISFDLDFFHFFYRKLIFAWDFLDLFHHVFLHSLILSFGLFEFVHLTFSQILYYTFLSFEFLFFFTLSLMILNNEKTTLLWLSVSISLFLMVTKVEWSSYLFFLSQDFSTLFKANSWDCIYLSLV